LVTNTFWLPLLVRDSSRGKIYVHVGRYPKGQMRLYRRAARLQAPSSEVADAIKRELPSAAQKVITIPYPRPQLISAEAPLTLEARAKIVLYVGRVHPEKGVHILVEAFARLRRSDFADGFQGGRGRRRLFAPAAAKRGRGARPNRFPRANLRCRGPGKRISGCANFCLSLARRTRRNFWSRAARSHDARLRCACFRSEMLSRFRFAERDRFCFRTGHFRSGRFSRADVSSGLVRSNATATSRAGWAAEV